MSPLAAPWNRSTTPAAPAVGTTAAKQSEPSSQILVNVTDSRVSLTSWLVAAIAAGRRGQGGGGADHGGRRAKARVVVTDPSGCGRI